MTCAMVCLAVHGTIRKQIYKLGWVVSLFRRRTVNHFQEKYDLDGYNCVSQIMSGWRYAYFLQGSSWGPVWTCPGPSNGTFFFGAKVIQLTQASQGLEADTGRTMGAWIISSWTSPIFQSGLWIVLNISWAMAYGLLFWIWGCWEWNLQPEAEIQPEVRLEVYCIPTQCRCLWDHINTRHFVPPNSLPEFCGLRGTLLYRIWDILILVALFFFSCLVAVKIVTQEESTCFLTQWDETVHHQTYTYNVTCIYIVHIYYTVNLN